jgi:hypothetical protein
MKSIKRFAAGFLTGVVVLTLSSVKIAFAPHQPPVGGEVIAVNPLAILAPYLLLIATVAVVLLAMWKALLAGRMRLGPPTV